MDIFFFEDGIGASFIPNYQLYGIVTCVIVNMCRILVGRGSTVAKAP